ncbi:hypothetical protein Tco_1528841 [Tanacetum coccineum]
MPRVMVERFVKEHLRADYVIGSELMVSWFGLASGLVEVSSIHDRVAAIFEDRQPSLLLRSCYSSSSNLSLCKFEVLKEGVTRSESATVEGVLTVFGEWTNLP